MFTANHREDVLRKKALRILYSASAHAASPCKGSNSNSPHNKRRWRIKCPCPMQLATCATTQWLVPKCRSFQSGRSGNEAPPGYIAGCLSNGFIFCIVCDICEQVTGTKAIGMKVGDNVLCPFVQFESEFVLCSENLTRTLAVLIVHS